MKGLPVRHSQSLTLFFVALFTLAVEALTATAAFAQAVGYDIVYLRAPRKGDATLTDWPEVFNPVKMEAGTDLMLLKANATEEVLLAAGKGAVLDPVMSFDGTSVYFAYFPDVTTAGRNYQRNFVPKLGSDLYRMNLTTRAITRLTWQTWDVAYGGVKWSSNPLTPSSADANYLGYGIFNIAPCPLPGGKLMFVSNRDGFISNKDYTFPNLRLYVLDEMTGEIEKIGYLNIGSAMHPVALKDGRVMFSSYESQGLRDQRVWSLWSILPDGRYWEPMFGSFKVGSSMHFQTQLSDGRVGVVEYYNLNNEGFGTLLAFNTEAPAGQPDFGSFNAQDTTNPLVRRGRWFFNIGHPYHLQPRYTQYRFSPPGLSSLTAFSHGEDNAADVIPGASAREQWAGKVTHPSGAPNNDVLVVYSPGPVNNLNRPTTMPRINGGIYLLKNGASVEDPKDLVQIKLDPNYNAMMPKAVVPYSAIHGVTEPTQIDWLPNNGTQHIALPAGTPFGLIGTSTFYRRDSKPGNFEYIGFPQSYDGLDRFNVATNDENPNWFNQGADAGKYNNADIHSVRIVGMEGTLHRSYGPNEGPAFKAHQGRERLRILGEIPLRKKDASGNLILDPDGNPDTSFLAKIPANTPFTFHMIDSKGMLLAASQTWHQVRPGEVRSDCGGCHAHSQQKLSIAQTAAGKSGYVPTDLTQQTPVMTLNAAGDALQKYLTPRVLDVEFHRDIKPVLQRSCVSCHAGTSAPVGLRLDDASIVDGFDNTYNRLANDISAKYGIKPVISGQAWRGTNASRYVRMFQSRRSLLMWKLWGARLDGWTNAQHPTETTLGDAATLPSGADPNDADIDFNGLTCPPPGSGVPPLSNDEKLMFSRWIDLGSPVDSLNPALHDFGWFNDEQKPVLTLAEPPMRGGSTFSRIRFGAFDNYSGLDRSSLSVTANFVVDGLPAGSELISRFSEADHVWTMALAVPIMRATSGVITVRAKDLRGNLNEVRRNLSANADAPSLEAWLDIDGSGVGGGAKYQLTTDGVLLIRYLLGLRGATLVANATAPSATRNRAQIEAHLAALLGRLDVDGDSLAEASADGMMILRYLLGLRGAALTQGGASPLPPALIEASIRALVP